jgi:hypothetical protein
MRRGGTDRTPPTSAPRGWSHPRAKRRPCSHSRVSFAAGITDQLRMTRGLERLIVFGRVATQPPHQSPSPTGCQNPAGGRRASGTPGRAAPYPRTPTGCKIDPGE